jgi:hypothetical protein
VTNFEESKGKDGRDPNNHQVSDYTVKAFPTNMVFTIVEGQKTF